MISSSRITLLAAAAFAALVAVVAPASAQGWGGHGGWDRGGWEGGHRGGWDRPGWGWRRHHHRPHCWVEERPVRVHTPWGPRMRYEPMRVCR